MARVQFNEKTPHFVPLLGVVVEPDEVVEVPDELFGAFVPDAEHRSENHPWSGIEAPAKAKAKKSTAKQKEN